MVTLPPEGMAAGAVYVVADPLAVTAGWNEPQADAPQAAAHVTCGFTDTSLSTVALNAKAPPTWREAGGAGAKRTEIGMGATMVMVEETDRLGSAADVAVTLTVFPEGMDEGAV